MSDLRMGIDFRRIGKLDGIGEFQPVRAAQPRRAFGDVAGEIDHLPRVQNGTVALGQCFFAALERAG